MKKLIFSILFILSFSISFLYGEYLTYEQFINKYVDIFDNNIPDSYHYIQVKYKNIDSNKMYDTLQKGIYLNLIPNLKANFPAKKYITQKVANKIIQYKFDIVLKKGVNKFVTDERLDSLIKKIEIQNRDTSVSIQYTLQERLMQDVYKVLTTEYIDSDTLDTKKLEYGAIQGMTNAVGDKFTIFFPPQKAQSFSELLEGNFQGIGAYIEMIEPGKLQIISPIEGSPAQEAGLLPGDIITHINGEEIDYTMSIYSAVSKIKGPIGTNVTLTIKRDKQESFDITITRAQIKTDNISTNKKVNGSCYVQIPSFTNNIYNQFRDKISKLGSCGKIILDLRNNPGGSLDQVSKMLSHFVPTGEPTVIIKSKFDEKEFVSEEVTPKIINKPIVILINKGTASAAEILTLGIKEYNPKSIIIGEQSFGKGSVQEVINYKDGSILKYTIAKRYSGKKEINIDHIGIKPDINIQDKLDTPQDEIIEFANKYRF